MGRCRIVAPASDRIYLVDAARKALTKLKTVGKVTTVDGGTTKTEKATPAEIAEAERRLAQAEADGDWLDVKRRLSYGEMKQAQSTAIKDFRDGRVKLDFPIVEIAQAVAYLLAWSLVDEDGQPIPIQSDEDKLAALQSFDPESVREIVDAINAHVEEIEAAEEERKNAQSGERQPALS